MATSHEKLENAEKLWKCPPPKHLYFCNFCYSLANSHLPNSASLSFCSCLSSLLSRRLIHLYQDLHGLSLVNVCVYGSLSVLRVCGSLYQIPLPFFLLTIKRGATTMHESRRDYSSTSFSKIRVKKWPSNPPHNGVENLGLINSDVVI